MMIKLNWFDMVPFMGGGSGGGGIIPEDPGDPGVTPGTPGGIIPEGSPPTIPSPEDPGFVPEATTPEAPTTPENPSNTITTNAGSSSIGNEDSILNENIRKTITASDDPQTTNTTSALSNSQETKTVESKDGTGSITFTPGVSLEEDYEMHLALANQGIGGIGSNPAFAAAKQGIEAYEEYMRATYGNEAFEEMYGKSETQPEIQSSLARDQAAVGMEQGTFGEGLAGRYGSLGGDRINTLGESLRKK